MEGVDRNLFWLTSRDAPAEVALLMEGVDRNKSAIEQDNKEVLSPSSWRAWIEINKSGGEGGTQGVALLMEGVDRNSAA